MVLRGFVAGCCVVVGLAAPAQAQDCTTELVRDLLVAEDPGDPPYPIVQVDPDGSVHVYPQNVVPGAEYAAGQLVENTGALAARVEEWVDCVV